MIDHKRIMKRIIKARLKGTNDEFQEIDEVSFKGEYDCIPLNELEFETDTDEYWNELYHNAVLAALPECIKIAFIHKEAVDSIEDDAVFRARKMATALIEQLKNEAT